MQKWPQRRSPRHQEYDYSTIGAYFLTICTHQKVNLLCEIVGGNMKPNAAGTRVAYWWNELQLHYFEVATDYFVVMPNHVHGIMMLDHDGGVSIPDVIGWYKTMTTNAYIRGVKEQNWFQFDGKVWQRSFYARIIRDDNELGTIREYIRLNPSRWERDLHHPETAWLLDKIRKELGRD